MTFLFAYKLFLLTVLNMKYWYILWVERKTNEFVLDFRCLIKMIYKDPFLTIKYKGLQISYDFKSNILIDKLYQMNNIYLSLFHCKRKMTLHILNDNISIPLHNKMIYSKNIRNPSLLSLQQSSFDIIHHSLSLK